MQDNYYLQYGTSTLHPSHLSWCQYPQYHPWTGPSWPHDPSFLQAQGLPAYQVGLNTQDEQYLQNGTRTVHPSNLLWPRVPQAPHWPGPSWFYVPSFQPPPGLPSYQLGVNMQENPHLQYGTRTLPPPAPAHVRTGPSWSYRSTIRRPPGPWGHRSSSSRKKCYHPNDPTLTIVDREDEHDFSCEEFNSPKALMSCGHTVTPMSLTKWCWKLLDDGRTRFVCGQTSCNVEWSFEEVCRMALLTPQEKMHFEKAMKTNVDRTNTKACPGCSSPVVRSDQSNLRVRCSVCSVTNRRIYDFCWQCMREWRGPDSRPDHCGNDDCRKESVKTLRMCPEFKLGSVMCPSTRACPSCGILLQHDKKGCKNVKCLRCKVNFCFVCLNVSCSQCSLAPRQTSIPAWKKK